MATEVWPLRNFANITYMYDSTDPKTPMALNIKSGLSWPFWVVTAPRWFMRFTTIAWRKPLRFGHYRALMR